MEWTCRKSHLASHVTLQAFRNFPWTLNYLIVPESSVLENFPVSSKECYHYLEAPKKPSLFLKVFLCWIHHLWFPTIKPINVKKKYIHCSLSLIPKSNNYLVKSSHEVIFKVPDFLHKALWQNSTLSSQIAAGRGSLWKFIFQTYSRLLLSVHLLISVVSVS